MTKKDLVLTEEIIEPKYRNFIVLLYKDSTCYSREGITLSYDDVIRIIKSHKYYAYIEHRPESNEKKVHTHVVLKFDNATKKSTLAKKLGVPENYIDIVKNKRSACRYLIHKDDDDKIQYSINDVFVSKPFERDFMLCFDDYKGETEIIDEIYSFIDQLTSHANENYFTCLRDFILFVNSNAYDTIYKRYRFEFQDYLKSKCV